MHPHFSVLDWRTANLPCCDHWSPLSGQREE